MKKNLAVALALMAAGTMSPAMGFERWAEPLATSPPAGPSSGRTESQRLADASPPAARPAGDSQPQGAGQLPWHQTMADAYEEAGKTGRPIVLVFGAPWCDGCRYLEGQIAEPAAQQKLGRWTRVHIDIERLPAVARQFHVATTPAVHAVTSSGRSMASHAGALTAAELGAWLEEHHEKATAAVGQELLAAGAPDAAALKLLVERLKDADASTREAAIRRLLPHPAVAAVAVAEAMASGNLSARLSALELLSAWKAPVDQIDPWEPRTVTEQRVAALRKWAAEAKDVQAAPGGLDEEALAEAQRQIDALLAAVGDAEARAIRERLARSGKELLPHVYKRIEAARTDQARERLTALRYRLAASDALALQWPGGLDRLAATRVQTRHEAIGELAKLAKAEDAPLLVELFSDRDALMREISLRTLQSVGGAGASASLTEMLRDPDANVRAAVLKQFTEAPPSGAALGKVIEFALAEKDSALVVHAVRVLRGAKDAESLGCLIKLLPHASWQVRAEAVEAIQERVGGRSSDVPAELRADAYVQMMKLLDDEDSFVVSRAATAVQSANLPSIAGALLKAAEKHPQIAPQIIRSAGENGADNADTLKSLRTFAKHESAEIRAAAVAALAEAVKADAGPEMAAMLSDGDSKVRATAARTLVQLLGTLRPEDGVVRTEKRSWLGMGKRSVVEKRVDPDQWFADFRKGKHQPDWLKDAVPELEKLLASGNPAEQAPAAVLLAAMGKDEKAVPVLLEAVAADQEHVESAAEALAWLPLEKRLDMFDKLVAMKLEEDHAHTVVEALAETKDPRIVKPLWALLAGPGVDDELATVVEAGIRSATIGDNEREERTPEQRKISEELVAQARTHAAGGSEHQRLVALGLLLTESPADAAAAAEKIRADAAQPEELRRDAFQVLLLSKPPAEAVKLALGELEVVEEIRVGALGDEDEGTPKRIALKFLTSGGDELQQLRQSSHSWSFSSHTSRQSGQIVPPPAPPAGMKFEHLSDLLNGRDPVAAAYAGYLAALLGKKEGMEALVRHWRGNKHGGWTERVYQAAAAINDDELTPVLEEVYATYGKDNWRLSEFYWTIRGIKGEKITELRGRIRKEVPPERLR